MVRYPQFRSYLIFWCVLSIEGLTVGVVYFPALPLSRSTLERAK